jgi:hypothetical protein
MRLIRLLVLVPLLPAVGWGQSIAPLAPGPVAPPPVMAPPLPGVGLVLPPAEGPDRVLEAAIRQRLFNGPFDLVPGKSPDPDGTEWQQARTKGERPRCAGVGDLRYVHNWVDLNGDGQPEVVAAVVGSFACGSRGCTLYVFRQAATGLELVNELDLFESPLLIDGQSRYGWQNLTLPAALALGGPPGERVQLVFDGRRYQRTTEALPQAPPGAATVVLQLDPVPFEQLGQPLPCGP